MHLTGAAQASSVSLTWVLAGTVTGNGLLLGEATVVSLAEKPLVVGRYLRSRWSTTGTVVLESNLGGLEERQAWFSLQPGDSASWPICDRSWAGRGRVRQTVPLGAYDVQMAAVVRDAVYSIMTPPQVVVVLPDPASRPRSSPRRTLSAEAVRACEIRQAGSGGPAAHLEMPNARMSQPKLAPGVAVGALADDLSLRLQGLRSMAEQVHSVSVTETPSRVSLDVMLGQDPQWWGNLSGKSARVLLPSMSIRWQVIVQLLEPLGDRAIEVPEQW